MSAFLPSLNSRVSISRYASSLALAAAACLTLPLLTAGCNRASAGTTAAIASPQAVDSARRQLDLIPPPSKTRYMAVRSLTTWENPYLTVQQNMATLHVTLADANPSQLGTGGMLRPVGARRQDLTIRLSDLPAALNAIPEDSWPYGRVIAIEEAHDVPASDRPAVRRTVEAAIKALGDMGVVVYEWNDGSGLLR
jgi:cell division septation protein DedD